MNSKSVVSCTRFRYPQGGLVLSSHCYLESQLYSLQGPKEAQQKKLRHQNQNVLYPEVQIVSLSTATRAFPANPLLKRYLVIRKAKGFSGGSAVKNLPVSAGDEGSIPGQGMPHLEEGMTTRSSILPWRIPWIKVSGRGYSPWGHKELDMTKATQHKRIHAYSLRSEIKIIHGGIKLHVTN